MNWIAAIIAGSVFTVATLGGTWASYRGWGLSGKLDQPVSVRKDSLAKAGRAAGPGYFSSRRRHRRHHHGGYRFGK